MGYPTVRIAVRWRPEGPEGQCPTCREYWSLTPEFWETSGGMRRCKACVREYHRLRAIGYRADQAQAAIINARQRMYYATHRAKRLAGSARWREANREKTKADRRAYYLAHRDEELARAKAYDHECRDVIRLKRQTKTSDKAA